MAIKKEWSCIVHGDFDSTEQRCPSGCGASMVVRAFRTPPMVGTGALKRVNATLEGLASDHGLTNMSNAGGEGMRKADYFTHKRLREATELAMHAPNGGKTGDGRDLNQYFKPISDRFQASKTPVNIADLVVANDTRSSHGALFNDGGVVHTGGVPYTDSNGQSRVTPSIPLARPRASLQAPAFAGQSLGLPQGDGP